jgi:spermidine/putrescine transport system permease protein
MDSIRPQRTHRGEIVSRQRLMFRASVLGGPALAWLAIFFVLPVLSIVIISFLTRGELGTIGRPFTLENFQRLAGFGLLGFESLYPLILLRSLFLGVATAVFQHSRGVLVHGL